MAKRILLVGGGSGGHVFPLMAVASSLRKFDPSVELMVLGEGPFLAQACADNNLPFKTILAGKMRRYFSLWSVLDPFKAIAGFFQSLWILFWYMPDAVFTKGGYVSAMPALVARLYFIPVFTHESDSVPGASNIFIGKIARTVFVAFGSATKYFKTGQAMLVGNPVRPELLNGDRAAALQQFNLRADRKTILVIGGSQGAKRVNDIILESLVLLVKDYQLIHQCGQSQLDAVKAVIDQYEKEGQQSYGPMIQANYRLYPFFSIQEMTLAYAAADVVISRGGAGSIAEIAALGKPAIIIPITNSQGDHQTQNALEFQKYGGDIIQEANLTSHILLDQIKNLLDATKSSELSAKIKSFAKLDAADRIAQVLLQ
ncbi:MAG TPA: UDP-N-acetylglucosamine--N-acetylmuramyl-(pentapeptide) pyrophosphoryl-undecaprenol N-acetylglucosamine transferase [Candidatus Paceibacterota bacterium]|nr:UDP-N-acetylglucosamine--N-acetylmuramyl-(pentapeptide) pyrophosphoryl-undecaprenol N-acetylglucosamine transferase [Candidatus Paceibacterota bacterium]